MKYIMLPIHSNWVCSIMNGIKKIEVRSGTRLYNAINRLIDEQGKAPCLIYCTQGGKQLVDLPQWVGNELHHQLYYDEHIALLENSQALLNGKVVAMFEASAERIIVRKIWGEYEAYGEHINFTELSGKSCLSQRQIIDYVGESRNGTAIYIHNLVIFDKPKELWEFDSPNGFTPCEKCLLYKSFLKGECKGEHCNSLYKSPQSYCFCEVDE